LNYPFSTAKASSDYWFPHLATTLGFVALPPLYWLLLAMMLVFYVVLTQLAKTWLYPKFCD
jgi:Mg2+-importing ATPase